jgi:hypothetical protein
MTSASSFKEELRESPGINTRVRLVGSGAGVLKGMTGGIV